MPNKKNNLTIFQSLRKVISGSNDIQSAVKAVNSYGVDDSDILFKTGDRNEYERQLLQMKQQNAISKQWKRAKFDLANRSLAGLTDVKMMYRDVDLMDGMYGFPEIGTALDVVMEESCFIRKKFLVNVESKSERVKSILEDLLVNRLQINVMLPMICRAMCKYGNSFMLLDINTENGVMNWKQLPVYEIERFEAGMYNPYAYAYTNINSNNLNSDDTTKFVWVGQHEFVPYQNWQVAHFRLLYDSIFLPYGCSFLHKARRAWRMLSMMEDMMLIYRLERSVERRVFKINVGNMNEDDIPAHIEEIANDFKRTPIIDPMTGQLDLKKNILNVAEDYFIPVRDDNAATPIDTLQGAQNMTAIDDIKFMQAKLVTALRVPKPFLNYEDSTGDGKNLSLLDVRFMRTVNRIQQALLMELNKVCIIHLYMLGFEDELTNFSLSMNNPSSQVEMMEIDNLAKKITTAKDATAENGEGGLPLMSMMRAWKEIMGWSDAEIKENLEQMRLEKALGMELLKTPEIIKKTGLFDPVDNIYGEPGAEYSEGNPDEEGGAGGGFGGGGGSFGGGAPVGDEDFDFGEEEGEEMGAEGEMDMNAAAEEEGAEPAEGEQPMGESTKMLKNLLVEVRGEKPTRKIVKKKRKTNESLNNVPIFQKSFLINKDLNSMVNRLETIMAESGKSDDVFEKKTFKKEEVLGD